MKAQCVAFLSLLFLTLPSLRGGLADEAISEIASGASRLRNESITAHETGIESDPMLG
mgnify:CR=1 FL=1